MSLHPSTKELRIFERLEDLTKNESFDSAASFVQKFMSGNLDLNNTIQSIPEVEEDGESCCSEDDGGCEAAELTTPEKDKEESEEEEVEEEEEEEEEDSSEEWSEYEEEEEESSKQVEKRVPSTSVLLLNEMKRSLELQEMQFAREKKAFSDKKIMEESQLQKELKQVETQKKSVQRLVADYHKMKTSKTEQEGKIKDLTDKLRDTKLEMSKRISRWGDQQKRLEERVKALEQENSDLKKQKPKYKPPVLKRPSTLTQQNQKVSANSKLPKRIHFADEKPNAKDDVSQEVSVDKSDKSSNDNAQEKEKSSREVCLSDEEADKTMPSDYVEVRHPCGTITRVTKDAKFTRHVMLNQDVMDEFEDCSVRYYYAELGFSQYTYPNGDEIIEYDGGVIETTKADGTKIYTYSNGIVKLVDPQGSEDIYFADGSSIRKELNGETTIEWPSGQKEVRTSTFTKRIFTNGTISIKYHDGSVETRYFNGRIRRKDKNGVLIQDTKRKRKDKMPEKVNKTV